MSVLDPRVTQSQGLSYSLMYLRQHFHLESETETFISSPLHVPRTQAEVCL